MNISLWQALILTHRRAALVAVMPGLSEPCWLQQKHTSQIDWRKVANAFSIAIAPETAMRLENIASLLAIPPMHAEKDFALYHHAPAPVLAIAIGQTTTAEVLSKMYDSALQTCGIGDEQVTDLGVGVGPGSFTGLRLGCAFANGLQCGRKRRLWAFPNAPLAMLGDVRQTLLDLGLTTPFWGQPLPEVGDDEFAIPVTLMDLLYALLQWPTAKEVSTLEPVYGRLPGPVLKLQEAAAVLGKAKN